MSTKFKTVITTAGAAKLAAATVPGGKKVNLSAMAVGDGNGKLPVPDAGQTKLVHEVWRHALNKVSVDNKNKNYIVAVVITFFYTIANYILSMNDMFLTQPFGLNIGTLFPGPLAFRWTFQFYDQSQTSAELADLLERVSPYFLNSVQVFGVIIVEAIVFLALIAFVYRRQEI